MVRDKVKEQVNGHPWATGYMLLTTTITLILIVLQSLGKI